MPRRLVPTRVLDHVDEIDAKYGSVIQLVIGTIVLMLSVAVVVVALDVRSQGRATELQAAQTAEQSRIACQPTRRFGPPLAAWYEQHHVLRPDELAAYRETIPASCP